MWQTERMILVTGFEPFGTHTANPTEGLAKAVDGRRGGDVDIVGPVLPRHPAAAPPRMALAHAGTPAYTTNPAGTYLCNQTLYWTLHAVHDLARPPAVGFIHFPLLPAMVAAAGLEQPSMDFPLMLRAVETVLGGVARADALRY